MVRIHPGSEIQFKIKNEKCKMRPAEMNPQVGKDASPRCRPIDLLERTVKFSRTIIRLYKDLESHSIGKILSPQLLRAATSVGANFHEAQGGQSKSDFISKISIAQKEAIECSYWLRLIEEEEIISNYLLDEAVDECKQLTKILSSILISAKQK